MEQILRSLLQKQGYEHIGIVNAEKKIWGYSKDGVYHFCCADDLSDIDRKSIGFTDDICVLSIVDDIVVNVEDLSKFATGIVIDNNNFITKELRQMEAIPMNTIQPYYQLKRIKSDSIVIIRSCYIPHDYQRLNRKSGRDWESYVQMRSDHPQFIPLNFDKLDWVTFLVYLDGKCIQDAKLYMYLDEYYFFRTDTSIRIYHSEEGWVFDGCLSYLWDTTSNLYLVYIKEPNIVSIQTIDSCRKQVFDTNDFFKYQFFSKDNRNYSLYDYHVVCSDHYLIIPFSAHNWIFVISDDYYFSAKCIEIDNNSNLFFQRVDIDVKCAAAEELNIRRKTFQPVAEISHGHSSHGSISHDALTPGRSLNFFDKGARNLLCALTGKRILQYLYLCGEILKHRADDGYLVFGEIAHHDVSECGTAHIICIGHLTLDHGADRLDLRTIEF